MTETKHSPEEIAEDLKEGIQIRKNYMVVFLMFVVYIASMLGIKYLLHTYHNTIVNLLSAVAILALQAFLMYILFLQREALKDHMELLESIERYIGGKVHMHLMAEIGIIIYVVVAVIWTVWHMVALVGHLSMPIVDILFLAVIFLVWLVCFTPMYLSLYKLTGQTLFIVSGILFAPVLPYAIYFIHQYSSGNIGATDYIVFFLVEGTLYLLHLISFMMAYKFAYIRQKENIQTQN